MGRNAFGIAALPPRRLLDFPLRARRDVDMIPRRKRPIKNEGGQQSGKQNDPE
jgi:hypothetical protein